MLRISFPLLVLRNLRRTGPHVALVGALRNHDSNYVRLQFMCTLACRNVKSGLLVCPLFNFFLSAIQHPPLEKVQQIMATTVASNVAPKSPHNRRLRVKSVTSIEPTHSNGSGSGRGSNLDGSDGNVLSGSAGSIIMSPKAYSAPGSRVGKSALQIERRDPSKSPRPNRQSQTLGIHTSTSIPRTPTRVLAKKYLLEEENSPSKLSTRSLKLKSPHSIRSPAGKIVLGDEQRRRKVAESPRASRKMTVALRQDIGQYKYIKARNLRHASPPVRVPEPEPEELNMSLIDSPTSPLEELEESIPEPFRRKDREVRSSSPRKHTSTREHHHHNSSSPRKLHTNQKSPGQKIDFDASHDTDLYLEAEDTDAYLSTLMKELRQHTELHREPLSDQAMIQLHLSRTQQLQGPEQGQGSEEEAEAGDDGIIMTLWEMKEQFRRDFPDAPVPSDAALKQRYKILGLVLRTGVERKSPSYSNRLTSTSMVNTKHFGDKSAVTRVPVAIPWLDREDNQDNDGSLENAGESEDASPQTHRKSGVTSLKSLASKVALAAKSVKSGNKTPEMSKGHSNVEDNEQHEEGATSKSKKEKKDKVEEKLKKKEEKHFKKIEKAKQKLARAQRKLEKEKKPSKTEDNYDDDDTKTIHEEHEAKVDSESTIMGLSSESAKVDLESSDGLEEPEVVSLLTKKAGNIGDSSPSKRRKSTLGKAMGRMSKILHPSHVKDKKWDELAMSQHSALNLSVSHLQDSEETTGERMPVSVTEQVSLQAQEHTENREVDTNRSTSHPHDAYCDLHIIGQQALQFLPALKAQVEDHDAEYGEEALKSEPKPSRPDRKSQSSSRTRTEDGHSSRSEDSRSRTSRSPSEVRSSATKSSTSTCSTSSRRGQRSRSPSSLPADAARSPSHNSQRSNAPSTVSGDAPRSPSRSSSRKSKSPSTLSGDAARSPSRSSRPSKPTFTMTSEVDKTSSRRSNRRSQSPSTLSGREAAKKNRCDEDDTSTRKHVYDDSSKLRRNSRSVSPSGLKEDISRRRRETRSASPSILRVDIAKLRDADVDRRNSRRASRRASATRSGPLDDKTFEESTGVERESRIRRASRQASNSKTGAPDEEAREGSLTTKIMSPDEESSITVNASTASRVRFADQHLEDYKACKEAEGSSFAFAESQVVEDESEHTLSDTEFETIYSMPQLPENPDRLVQYVKSAGLITGTADVAVRCTSEGKTFAERLAAMSTLGRRPDESEVNQVANAASSCVTTRLKPRASSSGELEVMLKMVGNNGSSKNDQHSKSGDNASRVSRSSKGSRASTKASRSSGRSEQAGRRKRSSNSDCTGKAALTTVFQGASW